MGATEAAPTVEVLREARALYEANPSHAPVGAPVPEGEVCAAIALYEAPTSRRDAAAFDGAYVALERVAGMSLPRWNATHSTEQVLEAFDRAMAAEEARAA